MKVAIYLMTAKKRWCWVHYGASDLKRLLIIKQLLILKPNTDFPLFLKSNGLKFQPGNEIFIAT